MRLKVKLRFLLLLAGLTGLAISSFAQSPGAPQGPSRPVAPVQTGPVTAFRATNYEVHASMDAVGQVMNARAKVDFIANEAARTVEVELNQNLRVNSVLDSAGKPVSYERDDSVLQKLDVNLSDAVPAGGKITLFFDYGGPLTSRINSPDQAVPLSYMGKDGGYLLLPSSWFPLTDFPSNRYTGIFEIEVPGTMTVVGTGTSTGPPASVTPKITPLPALGNSRNAPVVSPMSAPPPPSMENERMLYTFRVDKPEAAGTFVMAPLQLSPENSAGMTFSVYTPPAAAATAQRYADSVQHILDIYNGEFGALPEPGMKIAQILDGTVDGYAAPGLLLVSARQWSEKPNERLLANLAAQQWWGDQVMAASASDVWVTDGLARYSEGLYVEQDVGQRRPEQGARGFRRGRADVRRRRAHCRGQTAGARIRGISLRRGEQGRDGVPHAARADG